MFGFKRIVIADNERGLLLRDRQVAGILEPGVHKYFDIRNRLTLRVFVLSAPEFRHELVDVMLQKHRALVDKYFMLVEVNDDELALVYMNGTLYQVAAPGTRTLFWKEPFELAVETVNIEQDYVVPRKLLGILTNTSTRAVPLSLANNVYMTEVAENTLGMLIVDGELKQSLTAGRYGYWKFNRRIAVEHADLRIQAMDVQGQEILTKDKVSLRINLTTQYQLLDPVTARGRVVNINDYLYRELQFALRKVVGTRTLDTLLLDKDELDQSVYEIIMPKVQDSGIKIHSVGIKDVILPGEMKEILNQVVQAEKVAQANVIKRREETAATRSLLNTAKLMDDNPTLLRLKELEVLEKVTEKVDKLTVYGGLESVLKDTIRIHP